MLSRLGSGRNFGLSDSHVLRPMITGWETVSSVKCLISQADAMACRLRIQCTVVTFFVTGLRPNQIHREGFGEIVAPILLVFTPGKSGLGFVIATAATIVLHFTHSLKSELGSVVYRLAQTRQTAATTSDRHRCLDGRMMLVIHDFEIAVIVVEQRIGLPDADLRIRVRRTAQLFQHLVDVVVVDVAVAAGPNEFAGLESRLPGPS